MRVHAYRVAQRGPRSLEALLDWLWARPIHNRSFAGKAPTMRLESLEKLDGFIMADFAAPRLGHGPGKMAPAVPVTAIAMEEGHSFAEDTAFVVDAATGYMALQYNHAGPRLGSVRDYLFSADKAAGMPGGAQPLSADAFGFGVGSVLRPEAYARLRRFGIFRSVEVEISLPGALAVDLEEGRSLSSVLNAPLPDGVETMSIKLQSTAARGGQLAAEGVWGIADDIVRLGNAVRSAIIVGKVDDDSRQEEVDLISERLSTDVRIQLGNGMRYDRNDRWNALRRALESWREAGMLPV
ncbi:hypothetical protein [Mesorhizobium sp. M0478]|uniref:hypothetical protein n=2 Tax=unclassified Mesorhizobium TaxID=325217 RepID=UPI0033392725